MARFLWRATLIRPSVLMHQMGAANCPVRRATPPSRADCVVRHAVQNARARVEGDLRLAAAKVVAQTQRGADLLAAFGRNELPGATEQDDRLSGIAAVLRDSCAHALDGAPPLEA